MLYIYYIYILYDYMILPYSLIIVHMYYSDGQTILKYVMIVINWS